MMFVIASILCVQKSVIPNAFECCAFLNCKEKTGLSREEKVLFLFGDQIKIPAKHWAARNRPSAVKMGAALAAGPVERRS